MTDLFDDCLISLVSKEDFRMAVELWESKGHNNVVHVDFIESTGDMHLTVLDYVDPTIGYFIVVSERN